MVCGIPESRARDPLIARVPLQLCVVVGIGAMGESPCAGPLRRYGGEFSRVGDSSVCVEMAVHCPGGALGRAWLVAARAGSLGRV